VLLSSLDLFGRDAVDVGAAAGERVDFAGVDVESGDAKFLFAVEQRERKADIAQADNSDTSFALLNPGFELLQRGIACGLSRHQIFRDESKMYCMRKVNLSMQD
jgi:hypothetical protein